MQVSKLEVLLGAVSIVADLECIRIIILGYTAMYGIRTVYSFSYVRIARYCSIILSAFIIMTYSL